MAWRSPKRLRDMWWKRENDNVDLDVDLAESKYLLLKNSLKDVCSLDDLKQRMGVYLSLGGCKEVFHVMTLVIKVCSLNLPYLFNSRNIPLFDRNVYTS